jgi:hypothetical protein
MKTLTTLLALALFCATAYGQTIKSLGFNTTNGEVVANTGTNVLTFTNAVVTFNSVTSENFSSDGAANFDLTNGELRFGVNDIYSVGSGTSFDLFVPIGFAGDEATTNAAITRTNLGIGATWLTNDNVTNFRTAVGLGATNDVSFRAVNTEEILVTTQIDFDTPTVASDTRTNLGLPLPALTNTSNVTMMRALAGSTNTNEPFSGTLFLMDIDEQEFQVVVSNGIILNAVNP